MISNFELLMDFKSVRDFAICMSKNNICCHKHKIRCCESEIRPSEMKDYCRRCWLDFLTSDEGLDLSYLDEPVESKTIPIKLSKKSMKILKDKQNDKD